MKLNMKSHKSLKITKSKISLLCEGVMACLSEILGAEFNLSFVFLFIKILTDVHDRVKILPLPEDIDSFLVFVSLLIETGSLLPIS